MCRGRRRNWEGDDLIPTLGLVLNTTKEGAFQVIRKVMGLLEERNAAWKLEAESARSLGREGTGISYSRMREEVDIVIVFGGDGTFLHTAQYFFGTDIPLLGVNMGRLGFLTEIETNELEEALEQLLKGNYQAEKRMTLEGRIIRDGKEIYRALALNDIVLSRMEKMRTIKIELAINKEVINSYRADGLIIATPTGSTAYSLSAGGPIVNPQIRAIIATPICPHTLYVRPMVISDREELMLTVDAVEHGGDLTKVTADGNSDCVLKTGDRLIVTASDQGVSFVKLPGRTFYTILHKKMMVGLV